MQLTGLTALLRENRVYRDLAARLQQGSTQLNVVRAARPFVLAALASEWHGPLVVVTARVKRLHNVTEQLPVWLSSDQAAIYRFAEPAPQFYERALWSEATIRARIEALAVLLNDEAAPKAVPVVLASARALMQRTLPVNQFRRATQILEPGQRHIVQQLLARWLGMGYESASIVVEPGTFSRRGGVLDIFPMAAARPIRIEFFDDEIDRIRTFDPATQRSEGAVERAVLTVAREVLPEHTAPLAALPWFNDIPPESDIYKDIEAFKQGTPFPLLEHYLPYAYPNPVSLLDYVPQDALIVIEDRDELRDVVGEVADHAERYREDQVKAGRIAPEHPSPYLTWAELAQSLEGRTVLDLGSAGDAGAQPPPRTFAPGARYGGQLKTALTAIRALRREGARTVVVTEQAARLIEIWYQQDASEYFPISNNVTAPPTEGALLFINGTLHEGWSLNSEANLNVITDAELFGWSRPEPRRRKMRRAVRLPESDYADWREGDYVVHVDYGIGQFQGMRHRTIEGIDREYLVVAYEGTDVVFVPIHQADRLSRYIGVDDKPPALSKLGQQDWIRIRSKARKAVEEEARELLALYAVRADIQRPPYADDSHWQHELEASFPYVETEDQLRAVREVKADLELGHPMDRLICGDVGYGKTEVALRAAFKAVLNGRQVAVLVPTTILAQQHYETFANRLGAFPVTVEQMSRFRTKEDQQRVLGLVKNGEVDVVIGTHRILSTDVQFKNLGMVIIDEEQRFGVKQKEHFKRLRTQVDVLTLTATPIPRTLFMSLGGVRDISMIQTPPEERLPVFTHVSAAEPGLVRQAILREMDRGGQVFFVHNRIRTIDRIREMLEDLVPEARIITAHGQMGERQLESIMSAFDRSEYDVLLSTAIIESGIDIPNANTLIVDRADLFGLAQLYQLRGRVGRSAQQAYAYFFYPNETRLSEEARARLQTLEENTGLGSGYQIAMRDLEIRGAGDILSTRQTGHVAAIGLHLYTQLLTQAVQELKGKTPSEPLPVAATSSIILDLPVPAYLPTDWIQEIALRLQLYRRVANLTTLEELDAMRAELRDRFGVLPAAVDGLLYQIEIKLLAQQAGATAVLSRDRRIQIKLPYLPEINREALAKQLAADVTRTAIEIVQDREGMWRLRLSEILQAVAVAYRQARGV